MNQLARRGKFLGGFILMGLFTGCYGLNSRTVYSSPDPSTVAQEIALAQRGRFPNPKDDELDSILVAERRQCGEFHARATAAPNTPKCNEARSAAENVQTFATIASYFPGVGQVADVTARGAKLSKSAAEVYCAFDPDGVSRSKEAWTSTLRALTTFAAQNPTLITSNPKAMRILKFANGELNSEPSIAPNGAAKFCNPDH